MVHFSLARATAPTRLLITLFLALLLLGYVVATIYAYERTGLRLDGTRLRYQGAADDEVTEEFFFPISKEELLRLTHVHTYGMAMMFYLLGHVFILTQLRPRTKMLLLGLFFFALLTFLGAPWGVKYVSAGFGYAYLGSLAALSALAVVLSAIPIHEMWFAAPGRGANGNGNGPSPRHGGAEGGTEGGGGSRAEGEFEGGSAPD